MIAILLYLRWYFGFGLPLEGMVLHPQTDSDIRQHIPMLFDRLF
jgi:hypothetical protein